MDDEFVPETAIDYDVVYHRGGHNLGDEDFALFKCPLCNHVYLIDYEVDTVFLDGNDLSRRVDVHSDSFTCVACHDIVPNDAAWIGPKASARFRVTWTELLESAWAWAARP